MRGALITAAVLAASASLPELHGSFNSNPRPKPRRERPAVKRMVGGADTEIEAWNKAVDAKKQAKRALKAVL